MSEGKGTMLAKSMQKHAGRAKEKILQNLGKVDRTADEIFDDHLNNFNRQQTSANKLQKEFNNYIRCIRAAQLASKLLMDAVCEVYEPQWVGYDALQAQTSASESLWQDFAHKLGDQVLIPLNTYTGQFPEMKKKVEKRNRKLIDYDGQRHSFQSLQANSNKRKDEAKINKGREQLEEARRTYEILNTELHDELPALYDSRILFLVTNLQTLFATEQVFHNETAKIYSELEAIVDKLATESQRGSNTLRKQTSNAIKSSPVQSPVKQMNNSNLNNANNYQNQITTNGGGSSVANSPTSTSSQSEPRYDSVSPTPPEQTPENLKLNTALANAVNNTTTTTTPPPKPPTPNSAAATTQHQNKNQDPDDEPKYENTTGNNDVHNTIVETPSTPSTTPTTAAAAAAETSSETNNIVVVPQSPNANSVVEATVVAAASDTTTTTTNTIENDVIAVSAAVNEMIADKLKANEEAIAKEAMDRSQNNSSTKAVAVTTTTTTVATTTTKVARNTPQIPTEQLNGNGNTTTTTTTPPSSQSNGNIEENNKKSLDATTTDLPPGVLYRVKATYGYVKEDVDELSFEIGDIIRVIEYDDPEDQEEGWLMGQKEGTNEKGLFPANFTRPI